METEPKNIENFNNMENSENLSQGQTPKNNNSASQKQLKAYSEKEKLEHYEKSKFKKALLCKICGKSYTQNSGIWHHQKDKHGEFRQDMVEQICPKQQRVKRGRPKLQTQDENAKENQNENNDSNTNEKNEIANSPSKKVCQNAFSIEEMREITSFEDLDLDLLQNDHIKMMLSIIIEFGEPNKQRKYNILYNEFDDMDPFNIEQNQFTNELWPELFEIYDKISEETKQRYINQKILSNNIPSISRKNSSDSVSKKQDDSVEIAYTKLEQNKETDIIQELKIENIGETSLEMKAIKMKNFCGKVIQDIKKDIIPGFIQVFKIIWKNVYQKLESEVDENSIIEQVQSNLTQKNNTSFKILREINHQSLTLNQFLEYFVNCTIGYIFDSKQDRTVASYFGN